MQHSSIVEIFFLSETEKIREDINFQIRNCKHELTGEMF